MRRWKIIFWAALGLAVFGGVAPAFAAKFPDKPKRDSSYSDEAGLLDDAGCKRAHEICWALWKEQKIPLYMVTLTSLANHAAAGQTIEVSPTIYSTPGASAPRRNYGIWF